MLPQSVQLRFDFANVQNTLQGWGGKETSTTLNIPKTAFFPDPAAQLLQDNLVTDDFMRDYGDFFVYAIFAGLHGGLYWQIAGNGRYQYPYRPRVYGRLYLCFDHDLREAKWPYGD